MKEIIIIKATPDDVDDLQSLGRQTFLETFAPHNKPENISSYLDKAFTIEQLSKELKEKNSLWYFALIENEKAGYLKLNFGGAQTELQEGKAMEIERIYVQQQFQGKKIGKLLLEKAIEIARNYIVTSIWLGVWEKNTNAQAFYKKQGFIHFDQHSFFMGDEEQTDWLMKLTLKKSTEL